MFKLYCKNLVRKVTQSIKSYFERIEFEQSHCYHCKRKMTNKELESAKRWPVGGDDHTVPVCEDCVEEIIAEAWERRKRYWKWLNS